MRWSAPGRVNIIGEHTDYNDGLALPMAIPQRTSVEAKPATGGASMIRAYSPGRADAEFGLDTSPGDVSGWAAYVAGTAWALRELGVPITATDLHITSDVPTGAGLSSSAALECAVGCALIGLAGAALDRTALATAARRAENEYVGAPTGGMDQLTAMHGQAGMAVYLDTATDAVELVPFDLAAQGLELLVVDTRAPHRHADGEYGARRANCTQAADQLGVESLRELQDSDHDDVLARLAHAPVNQRRVRHVLSENARVQEAARLMRSGDLDALGPVLTRSHASLRDDYEITVPELDVAVEAALQAGALGARMTGGGFGGSIIALV
ncbi:MAG TPA: galactokinase, partial [Jiangellaceae bacterium]|nr:galactokinase [Jiangellaceae bacterium]